MVIRVAHYIGTDGSDYFDAWFRRLNRETRARVQVRIDRIEIGTFGDHKGVGQGVFELRIDLGSGYRVYYGRDGETLVILLGGGTKQRQARDIEIARTRWNAYRREKRHATKTP